MRRLVPIVSLCAALGACASQGNRPSVPSRVPLPSAPPAGEPAGTTGLHEADLRAQFGQPALVRRDGTATIWRFDGPACKAFFFFYTQDTNTAVWHVETLPRGSAIAADEGCLNALRARVSPPRPVS